MEPTTIQATVNARLLSKATRLFTGSLEGRIIEILQNARRAGAKDNVKFLTDGRMSAEVVRVVTVTDEVGPDHYPTTLFSADQAQTGSCTAKSTIFTANIAAGLMLEQFSRWLRHLPVDADIQLNLLSSELTVADA
jgi:hypothetical protein